jgi:DNA polymerase V
MITLDTLSGQGVSVHTGFPNPAADTSLKGLDLNQLLIHNSVSTYLMRVSGDEWQDIGIFAGDIALVDRALAIQSTDLVVWHDGSEFALSIKSRITRDAIVWGVVTTVIHQYRIKK